VWSHYYGNFDQDNTSTVNDANRFIGSSTLADFAGRQIWDNKYGDLRGDRRHQLKLYGFYNLDWNASVGAYAIFQSGQPWETLNPDYWRCLDPIAADRDENCRVGGTGSPSASARFGSCLDPASGGDGTGVCPYPRAVNAGEFTSDDHWQIDVNYTQNFPLADRYNIQLKSSSVLPKREELSTPISSGRWGFSSRDDGDVAPTTSSGRRLLLPQDRRTPPPHCNRLAKARRQSVDFTGDLLG
jgi:hypothetical protein